MSAPSPNVVDRSGWPPGPWDQEPDRIDWKHADFPCLILRHPHLGSLAGYVAVPPGHRYHGADAYTLDLEVPVVLCYAGSCSGRICHVPAPGEPDDVWWIGFDCAHAGDLMPALLRPPFALLHHGDVYRDVPQVTALVNLLADRLGDGGRTLPVK